MSPSPPLQNAPASSQPTYVGAPVSFVAGHFAGRTIRAQIDEVQQAEVGRKCGAKDRRVIDPPPVVNLRLFEVFNAGVLEEERELKDLTEMDSRGFLCHVDLFRVPNHSANAPPPTSSVDNTYNTAVDPSAASLAPGGPGSSAPGPSDLYCIVPSGESLPDYTGEQAITQYQTTPAPPFWHADFPSAPMSVLGLEHAAYMPDAAAMNAEGEFAPPFPALTASGPMVSVDPGVPLGIDTPSRCTEFLVGNTVVAPTLTGYMGQAVMFPFDDLAVCEEGLFFLHYETFNIFNTAGGGPPIPILAECSGGTFRVYNTHEFPGLRASTELTKHLSTLGVGVHVRQVPRKRPRSVSSTRKRNELAARPIAPTTVPAWPHHAASSSAGGQQYYQGP